MLSRLEIEIIRKWIDQGAKTASPEPASITEQYFTQDESQFWAFQPIVKPEIPILETRRELASPVDYFIQAKLQSQRLEFSDKAPRATLIRR